MAITRSKLQGKITDCHSHVGMSIKSYARLEHPYGQTLESLFYKQRTQNVDVNVVFPYGGDLFFKLKALIDGGINIPDKKPVSEVPFGIENTMVMREIFEFNPELQDKFIPFVSADTERKVASQVKFLQKLEKKYPVYGIKINPATSQAKISSLLQKGAPLLRYARERNIPFLLHTSPDPGDYYSNAKDALKAAEKNPEIRFALAHALVFHKGYLDAANEMPNVWVDTAALKIQADFFMREKFFNRYKAIEADFTDHKKVMRTLAELYPRTIIWGSDAPAYSYNCKRREGKDTFREFSLKGSYKDEKSALDSLPAVLKKKVANGNTLNWLFGD